MADRLFTVGQVEPFMKAAMTFGEQAVSIIDDLQRQNAELSNQLAIAKAAAAKNVELEKVAAANKVDAATATKFASMLADRAIISESEQEKYAAHCRNNATDALTIAMKALELSSAPTSVGHGIKTASHDTTTEEAIRKENALWMAVGDGNN